MPGPVLQPDLNGRAARETALFHRRIPHHPPYFVVEQQGCGGLMLVIDVKF